MLELVQYSTQTFEDEPGFQRNGKQGECQDKETGLGQKTQWPFEGEGEEKEDVRSVR